VLDADGTTRAFINLGETELTELNDRARADLKSIVMTQNPSHEYVYQQADSRLRDGRAAA
jgi:hypothetical protein